MRKRLALIAWSIVALGFSSSARAARIEELCEVRGVRPNQLTGYGLVVGLNSTGDTGQAKFTLQSVAAMLRRLGATIDPRMIQTKNAAAVVVTATLPPFASPGTRIDVTVSSLGNAKSLLGGTLVQTPLYGANRQVYAVAQGPLLVGGFSAGGQTGSSVSLNHTTVGRVPAGAIVEQAVSTPSLQQESLALALRNPNFITAQRIAEAIRKAFSETGATAVDGGTVRLKVPAKYKGNAVALLAELQALDVQPDAAARVVIDERTGTVVLGAGVTIGEVAVAQGGLTVEISERFGVSQPGPFGRGTTAVVPETTVKAEQQPGVLHHIPAKASLQDVVSALNALGARPRDLVAIFQALRTAQALNAEVEVQ